MEQYDCSDIDIVIAACVDEIWKTFDEDNSGSLDFEETKAFITATLMDLSDGDKDEQFKLYFKEFDEDGSGSIERTEMIHFIKKIAGL